jgi:type II secretory pathway component GspD/PulD (secretin)
MAGDVKPSGAVTTGNSSSMSYYLGAGPIQRGTNLSINVKNTDIRDLLTAIALNLGVNIVYIEDPLNISLKVDNVTPMQAFQVILTKMGLSHLQSENDIIVGYSKNLDNSVFKRVVITKITLKYLEAANIMTEIDKLGLPLKFFGTPNNTNVLVVQGTVGDISKAKLIINYLDTKSSGGPNISLIPKRLSYVTSDKIVTMALDIGLTAKIVTIDTNKYILWVKGTSAEVAAVSDLIKKVDLPENRNIAGTVTKIHLQYISSDRVAEILDKLGLDINVIDSGGDTKSLWVTGTTKAISEVKKIIQKIDVIDNFSFVSGSLISIALDYISADKLSELAAELSVKAKLLTVENNPKTVFAFGDDAALDEIQAIVSTLDVVKNNNEANAFVYPLVNISAEEATERLNLFQFKDVTTVMAKGKVARDIIVICPISMTQRVKDALESIDVAPQKISVPVDFSDVPSGATKLAARRDLLVSLTGLSSGAFSISSDVSRDNLPHFVLYIYETPDNVQ